MSQEFEIHVTEGPLKGRNFAVPAEGLRLGRLSACEISIPDPALSRTHCLFEAHDDALWVTDLASEISVTGGTWIYTFTSPEGKHLLSVELYKGMLVGPYGMYNYSR